MTFDRPALFRDRDREDGAKVTNIELFFDLVFVFAITQLSHMLLAHLTLIDALETLVVFAAVWWLWIYTSWATNWLDPEKGLVRAVLIAMMLGGLVLASALPQAFDEYGVTFALAYVTLQVGRTLVIVWASGGHNPARMRNFLRICAYFLLAAPFWLAGAWQPAGTRLLLWAIALAIEYSGPFLFFVTPGLGRSASSDWDISGAHMAERCALFIIIALGESVLVTGATFAALVPHAPTVAALVASFVASAAMWWVYFDTGAKRGNEAIETSDDGGRLARNGYTYLHILIVAGIIVVAVANELMLKHPGDIATPAFVLVMCGGPLLFLLGNQAFKWLTAERPLPPLSHFVGEVLLVAIGISALSFGWTLLATGGAVAAGLVATAGWEWFSLHGGWRRWTPWVDRGTAIALEDSER